MQTAVDVMVSGRLSNALVVADGVARRLHSDGVLAPDSSLLSVPGIADRIAAHPFAAARRRAELAAALASPLAESVGESYSRAAFEYLGFEQPVLQARLHRPRWLRRQERLLVALATCRGGVR
jgi:hypothetical protein